MQEDSASAEAVTVALDRASQEMDAIDILVNNAGIAIMGPIDEFRLEDFDRTVAVNIRTVFVAIQAGFKHMRVGGRIINIWSCNDERVPFGGECLRNE
jgi:3-oxoacyl-[acyl-carrier protein] reductase